MREYLDRQGNSPFAVWFESLDEAAAAKVTMAVTRLGHDNFSKVKLAIDRWHDYRKRKKEGEH